MEENFEKADSRNLPLIDAIMIGQFFSKNPNFYGAELRNVKTAMSGRESYGDDAIGYVQLRRASCICTLKCKICPEHKVRTRPYIVTMVVDENKSEVVSCQCRDCSASEGGCKHAVAFLMWVYRRSEEPSCTQVECYWRKSSLSRIGTELKFVTVKEMSKSRNENCSPNDSVFKDYIQAATQKKVSSCELLRYHTDMTLTDNIRKFSLHNFIIKCSEGIKSDVSKFCTFLKENLDESSVASKSKQKVSTKVLGGMNCDMAVLLRQKHMRSVTAKPRMEYWMEYKTNPRIHQAI